MKHIKLFESWLEYPEQDYSGEPNPYAHRPELQLQTRLDEILSEARPGQPAILAIDTSSGISFRQGLHAVNKVAMEMFTRRIEEIIVIGASDDIDFVKVITPGQKIGTSDFSSTGGNAGGFKFPFEYAEMKQIDPAIVVYITDLAGDVPTADQYGIAGYQDQVIWLALGGKAYNNPDFGAIIPYTPEY